MGNAKDDKPGKMLTSMREAGSAIVVTGAGGGIGSGLVRRLIGDGWRVLAVDLNRDGLAKLQSERSVGARLDVFTLDVSRPGDVERTARQIDDQGIAVAGLVNAAGILQDVVPFMSLDIERQRQIWDVNYFGAFYCTKWFGNLMIKNGGGSIVNITSINELRVLPLHAYGPTKVAMGSLTTLTAGEFGAKSVRVNSVAPGFTLTPAMQEKIDSGKRDVSALKRATAMRRLVEIDEVASVVSFLMSDESSAVTGVSIPVDAGWLTTSHWMNFGDLLATGSEEKPGS
ncbi:SDR family oxidoreductase [Mesorhizobium argentiipisi]|uniref:SDR family oxidoreductase n=1 Tax=Mesorhizobium argentiipisi TaxID=3015175 RepID=A0ABU8KCR2_9HYPH